MSLRQWVTMINIFVRLLRAVPGLASSLRQIAVAVGEALDIDPGQNTAAHSILFIGENAQQIVNAVTGYVPEPSPEELTQAIDTYLLFPRAEGWTDEERIQMIESTGSMLDSAIAMASFSQEESYWLIQEDPTATGTGGVLASFASITLRATEG